MTTLLQDRLCQYWFVCQGEGVNTCMYMYKFRYVPVCLCLGMLESNVPFYFFFCICRRVAESAVNHVEDISSSKFHRTVCSKKDAASTRSQVVCSRAKKIISSSQR